MYRPVILAVGAALIFAVTASAGAADRKQYVLGSHDLPPGTHIVFKGYVSAQQRAKAIASFAAYETQNKNASPAMYPLLLKALRLAGYEAGFQTSFIKGRLTPPGNGPLWIKSSASEFPTATSANSISLFYNSLFKEFGYRPFAFGPRIANQAHLWSVGGTIGGVRIEAYTLIWQDGRFVATVDVEGKVGEATAKEVIRLARVVANRLKHQ